MPIMCLMVRENHKMVREMSGKSQGILWGLMAGHPGKGFSSPRWLYIPPLSKRLLCKEMALVFPSLGMRWFGNTISLFDSSSILHIKSLDLYECVRTTRSGTKCDELSRDVSWLTHWGRVTHICVSKLTLIGSENGLSPSRRQAIIWTNAGILLIRALGTNFSEILSEIHLHSRKCMWKYRLRNGCNSVLASMC